MAETTRRVNVTLAFATTDEPADVADSVMAVVRDESRYAHDLETISVHAFDLADDSTEPEVQLVLDDSLLVGTYTDDPERANEHARNVGGGVVALPIHTDHRHKETDR